MRVPRVDTGVQPHLRPLGVPFHGGEKLFRNSFRPGQLLQVFTQFWFVTSSVLSLTPKIRRGPVMTPTRGICKHLPHDFAARSGVILPLAFDERWYPVL